MLFGGNFWTHDYISGINRLLEQLGANADETRGVLAFVRSRVTAERDFSSILSSSRAEKRPGGGSRLDMDLRECTEQIADQAARHLRLSDDLDKLCYEPLAATDNLYRKALKAADQDLRKHYTAYSKLRSQTAKHKSAETPRASAVPESTAIDSAMSTLRLFKEKYTPTPSLVGLQTKKKITLAGITYRGTDALDLLENITAGAKIGEYKAMLIGTYANVSTGAAVASSSRRHLKNDSIAYSDKFGQSLVDAGLLKPIAQLSNKFLNSPTSYYQWQPGLLELLDRRQAELEADSNASNPSIVLSPPQEIDRAPSPGLAADTEAYIQSILELDMYRCTLELEISKTYARLEAYELQRIAAVKEALQKYLELCDSGSGSGSSDWDPMDQLKEFTRQHRSGPFVPAVAVYHGRNGTVCQTFGVELEKSVFFTDLMLAQLEDIPLKVWLSEYSLEDVYKLRSQVNTGRRFNESIFRFFSTETICGTLLQYFLELPESVIPFTLYDMSRQANPVAVLRALKPANLMVLKQFLGFLRRYNAAGDLGPAMAHYILRPRAVSALTMDDEHPGKLLTLLLRDYDDLFKEVPETGFDTPPVMSPPSLSGGFRTMSPRLSPFSPEGNRPRTSSASALETTNGTHLIPLSLSPHVVKTASPKQEVRHGIKLSGVLPIGAAGSPKRVPSRVPVLEAQPTLAREPSLEPSSLAEPVSGASEAVPSGNEIVGEANGAISSEANGAISSEANGAISSEANEAITSESNEASTSEDVASGSNEASTNGGAASEAIAESVENAENTASTSASAEQT